MEWDIEDVCPLTEEKAYVIGIVEQLFDILSARLSANKFNESAACLSRCRTSIGKSRVRLLGVDVCSTWVLKGIRKEHAEVLSE